MWQALTSCLLKIGMRQRQLDSVGSFFVVAISCFPSPFDCFVFVFNAKSSGQIVTCQSNSMMSANVLMKAEFV